MYAVSYRVIVHEPVCPDCGSDDTSEEDVETGDGLTETALTCRACGTAWPVACVTDWDIPRCELAHPTTTARRR